MLAKMLEEKKPGFRAELKNGRREGFMSYTEQEIEEKNTGLNGFLIKMIYDK